ncbi:glycosyltransferase family 1 protein [candidate division KSB1 bacterium]|nr:glycosyltransferase family 1 protein [candidate division KSB1 bacterium]
MRITILALGSRGDVQPAVAVGKGLDQLGHEVKVASFAKYESLVRRSGLKFHKMENDPQTFLENHKEKIIHSGKNQSVATLLKAMKSFGPTLQRAARESLDACSDAQGAIYTGFASYFGRSIAMKKCIPEAYLAVQPAFSNTKRYPAGVSGRQNFSQFFNGMACSLVKNAIMSIFNLNVNHWRREELGLEPIHQPYLSYLRRQKVTNIGCYSRHVVPEDENVIPQTYISGFCYMDDEPDWRPGKNLIDFLQSGEKPFYFALDSVHFSNPEKTVRSIIDALKNTGQRGIIKFEGADEALRDLPDNLLKAENFPESWILPQMKAILHHGDSLATAAAMRSGIPSIVVTCSKEIPFWADRIYELDLGPESISNKKFNTEKLTAAIRKILNHRAIIVNAAILGERVRAENGARCAAGLIDKKFVSSLFAQTETNEIYPEDMLEYTTSFNAA